MKQDFADDEIEIDLLELARELLNRWYIIAIAMIVCAVIGFCYARFFTTPMYSSTATMYVLSKSTSITSYTDIQIGTSLTKDYEEVVSSRPVLENVIKNLDLDLTYSQLSSMVSVNNPTSTRILEIKVTDTDVNRAKLLADEIAIVSQSFISSKMDQDKPSILSYGYTDGKAVSHGWKWYTAVAAMIGFVAACALITLMYLLNDRIMTPEDLEKKVGMNVLASLPLEK